ncbi:MAG: phosphoribosylanthranilate isomerase [Methylotenera sp.]|nr:MAG: phosphoribosylanthranilate isomerase [Methylotenera sp.]
MRTRVKICGITNVTDAFVAIKHGADAIGLVFYEASPRNVTIQQAAEIARSVPPFVSVVGLFVNANPSFIQEVITNVELDLIQFHGDEKQADCTPYKLPFIKAVRVKPDTNLVQYAADFPDAKALLLDTFTEGMVGGTGQVFDWKLIPHNIDKPIILAGGLKAENVSLAIQTVKPYAVDISGGVESAKGIKDAAKIAAFMQQVERLNVGQVEN